MDVSTCNFIWIIFINTDFSLLYTLYISYSKRLIIQLFKQLLNSNILLSIMVERMKVIPLVYNTIINYTGIGTDFLKCNLIRLVYVLHSKTIF